MASPPNSGASKLSKHAAWYCYFTQHGQRVFCQRNITAVVNHLARSQNADGQLMHQRELPGSDDESTRRSGTRFPARNTQSGRELIEAVARSLAPYDFGAPQQDQTLRINVTSLKPNGDLCDVLDEREECADKRVKLPSVRCKCEITIWHLPTYKKPNSAAHMQLLRDSQLCTIHRFRSGSHIAATIELDELFHIKASKLFVPVKIETVMQFSLADSYRLQVSLYPAFYDDESIKEWPRVLTGTPIISPLGSDASGFPPCVLRLDGAMEGLLTTPVGGAPLEVKISNPSRRVQSQQKSDLVLQVELLWSKPQWATGPVKASTRTPPALTSTIKSEQVQPAHVEYRFQGSKTYKTVGHLCPFCRDRDFRSERLLQFHLVTNHGLFQFKFSTSMDALGNDAPHTMIVEVENHQDKRTEDGLAADEHWLWLRPRTCSFDLGRYLNGRDGWISERQEPDTREDIVMIDASEDVSQSVASVVSTPPLPDAAPFEPAPRLPGAPRPDSVPSTRSQGGSLTPAPSQSRLSVSRSPQRPWTRFQSKQESTLPVRGVAPRVRKKFPVPPPPAHGHFFRSKTKRVLQEGELLSESDQDVDECWLRHKHDRVIDSLSALTDSEKTFAKRWDACMLEERLPANRFVGDALIRFTEANKAWLSAQDMSVVFFKHASELILAGCVTHEIVQGCFQKLRQARDDLP